MIFPKIFPLGDLDIICALLGIIGSSVLIFYLAMTSDHVPYLLASFLILIICFLWFFIKRRSLEIFPFFRPYYLKKTLIILFFLLFTGSILSVYFRHDIYERPLIYFVIVSLIAGVIACEVLYAQRNYKLVLLQIIILGLSIAWTQILIFPSLVGNDPWSHYDLTTHILSINYIPEGYTYSLLPLFHLLVAATSLIIGLDYKTSTMLSVSLGLILCNVLFVYLIGKSLFRSLNIGLLASLMVAIANYHIFMAWGSIPNSLATIFIPIVVFLLLFIKSDFSRRATVLTFLLILVIIMTHTISAMCAIIFICLIWLGCAIYTQFFPEIRNYFSLLIPIGSSVIMFSWWIYASNSILTLGHLIKMDFSMKDIFNSAPIEFRDYVLSVPLSEQIFNHLGMFLFFGLSIIGVLYMISRTGNRLTFTVALLGITPLAISFPSMLTGHSILDQRWWFVAQIFLSIPLAVGLLILGTWKLKRNINAVILITSFVVIICFTNIMSPAAQMDNDVFTPTISMRIAPIESELCAGTILNCYDGICKTDAFFESRVYRVLGYNTEPFCQEIVSNNLSSLKDNLILVRSEILSNTFILFSSSYKLDINLRGELERADFSQIYDSGSVYAYL